MAQALGYVNTRKAILDHVDEEDKMSKLNNQKPTSRNVTLVSEPRNGLNQKIEKQNSSEKVVKMVKDEKAVLESQKPTSRNITLVNNYKSMTTFINESGLYSLILGSKLEGAKAFKRWVTKEVLPSIRKYGQYRIFNNPGNNVFKIENETDLHYKVVNFIETYYPEALIVPGLGENQDTSSKRIDSRRKGYMTGQPDIIIQNLHKHYNGMAIELKTPRGTGNLSDPQEMLLFRYRSNGYKVLVSSNYVCVYVCMYTSLFKNVAIMELQQTCNFTMHISVLLRSLCITENIEYY